MLAAVFVLAACNDDVSVSPSASVASSPVVFREQLASTASLIGELQRRAQDPLLATDASADFPRAAPPPLDEESVAQAEEALGFRLPPLLRRVYLRVANGGVGPAYGLLPLVNDGRPRDENDYVGEPVVELYEVSRLEDPKYPAWSWPERLIPFSEWGCGILSCIDCSTPEGAVWTFDPHMLGEEERTSDALARTHMSLREWLVDWLVGVDMWELMYEDDGWTLQEL
ncbi:MAG: SMI1/KNR4 family protein [Thermoanaerobaculaceae bacterium]|nr:SMI1/KNR4 family protein [Thermoanaerobaculaceae bacterium]